MIRDAGSIKNTQATQEHLSYLMCKRHVRNGKHVVLVNFLPSRTPSTSRSVGVKFGLHIFLQKLPKEAEKNVTRNKLCDL